MELRLHLGGDRSVCAPPFTLLSVSFLLAGTIAVALLHTTFVPRLLATLVWFALIRRIGVQRASAYPYLDPAFGVAVA